MGKTLKFVGVLVLFVALVGVLFRMLSGGASAASPAPVDKAPTFTALPAAPAAPAYPTPGPRKPTITPIPPEVAATVLADILATPHAEQTKAAATETARPPRPTPGPHKGPKILTDTVNHLTFTLPANWYGQVPEAGSIEGFTLFAEYDYMNMQRPSKSNIFGSFITKQLSDTQSFDDFVEKGHRSPNQSEMGVNPDNVVSPIEAIKIGAYAGKTFNVQLLQRDGSFYSIRMLYLQTQDPREVLIVRIDQENTPLQTQTVLMQLLTSIRFNGHPEITYFRDEQNQFALQLPAGWFATLGGSASIRNWANHPNEQGPHKNFAIDISLTMLKAG